LPGVPGFECERKVVAVSSAEEAEPVRLKLLADGMRGGRRRGRMDSLDGSELEALLLDEGNTITSAPEKLS